VTITEHIAPSMLVVVTGPDGAGTLIRQVITATARPGEDLVLAAGGRGRAVASSGAPPPAVTTVPGPPTPPGHGASAYQRARYSQAVGHWHDQVAAAQRLVAARTTAATAAWARRQRPPAAAPGTLASLSAEAALATSAVSGLIDQAGSQFGARRVVLLSVASLAGMPPPDQLNGDDVIVTVGYLPTAAAASAAQENLLAAGAVRASVLGPEATTATVDRLVTAGLSHNAVADPLSQRALFANDSPALLRSAIPVLLPLVSELLRPDVLAVINGYASATGGARHNLALSQARADAVAAFLEARGVPASSLVSSGHGATDLIAPKASGDNRRVVVVIEEPAS
jgi:outer membrane protein OmpA-like peptidoglycan-associated protein